MENNFVSRDEAIKIAREYIAQSSEITKIYEEPKANWHLYNTWGDEPCWYALAPVSNNSLASTNVIVISKITGTVIALTSANDEG